MGSLEPPRKGEPCPICGGDCTRVPDMPSDSTNPFLGVTAKDLEPKPEPPPKRPRGKRRPAEDRAHHGPQEDR
jgi:hypothetical protein